MLANPKITETKTLATKGERTDLVKNGFAVSGSVAGGLVYGLYDIFWESLFQGAWAIQCAGKIVIRKRRLRLRNPFRLVPGHRVWHICDIRGLECVSGSLTLTADEPANIAFEMLGIGSDSADIGDYLGALHMQRCQPISRFSIPAAM